MFDIKKQSEKMVEKNIEIHHHHHHHYVCVFPVNLFFFFHLVPIIYGIIFQIFLLCFTLHTDQHTHTANNPLNQSIETKPR